MVSREIEFSVGGALIVAGFLPIAIAVLASVPIMNIGLLVNFGGIGIILSFLGFFLMGTALFRSD